MHKLLKNDSAYEEYLSHKLREGEYRVTNDKLLRALEKRPTGISHEFESYVEEFECFVCEQVQDDRESEKIVTRRQYNCPLPRDPVTGEIGKHNWWINQWNIDKCGAKLLAHYIVNNIDIDMKKFHKQKMNMYDNNECRDI